MTARISDRALNVPTVPYFISNSFWEKKTLKIYKFEQNQKVKV